MILVSGTLNNRSNYFCISVIESLKKELKKEKDYVKVLRKTLNDERIERKKESERRYVERKREEEERKKRRNEIFDQWRCLKRKNEIGS